MKEMSYEECVARITKLLQAVEEEEETSGGENKVGDESEDSVSEEELPLYDRLCTIVGKDGTTKWKNIPPRQNSRARIHNIDTLARHQICC